MPISSSPVTLPSQTYDKLATDLSISVLDTGAVAASGRFRRYTIADGRAVFAPGTPALSLSSGDVFSGQFSIASESAVPQAQQHAAVMVAMGAIDAALQQLADDLGL
jgi:hypothetical protein